MLIIKLRASFHIHQGSEIGILSRETMVNRGAFSSTSEEKKSETFGHNQRVSVLSTLTLTFISRIDEFFRDDFI